ncbi:MAG: 50S ribosomal protein L5 [Nitrospirae bacterium CG_4_9_14_3_um_filter_53_35]|nr:MAG: 50S ribosomal protein L5 [Nitrospirae bacterium CG2_30_53_67]PIS37641.1 MAG: 50S ribosomal protein L5 [Nitrospirae bacterium CG08_land_8_20_14_0_20_52_24]PIV82602.1 MAG: 50S ribosomal protein L5 [Nitrospirae bacterium CG17_big_fil_post_rev_8_21_14_2_50_50_9]PIW86017.1 MAG: 50S ribosomal protein L5 [Nitrospirae bacterium CG_4_8_14_3_um_filter_50_41]PIX86879.1 MAG: 50S ribosomal protein L5 [Nitrospirae bacterium CG_4_10_14_3_um_filter_53_41]PJA76370.1 MAG: 50S ribosomal protein L5 [Nitro
MARLKENYKKDIVPSLMKQFGYSSVMQVPRLMKIVVNVGMGEAIQNPKLLESAVAELRQITGQQPVVTLARKSIANFKLREGMAVGCKVTLRKNMMYEFLDRLINTALPRIRDFRGVPGKSFDGRGNYSLGLLEQSIFPEIKYDNVEKVHGMDIIIVTSAKTDEEAKALLSGFHMPFRN